MIRDLIHELRIRAALVILCAADAVARWASVEFRRLCNSRSARQVSKMEKAKGLI